MKINATKAALSSFILAAKSLIALIVNRYRINFASVEFI